jgi:hypothetical protein
MNLEIGHDSIFSFVSFFLIVHIIHLVLCNLSCMSQQYIVRFLFSFFFVICQMSRMYCSYLLLLMHYFYDLGLTWCINILDWILNFCFFVCTKCFFHYARLVENHVSLLFFLFVHWSVNCLFVFFLFLLLLLFDISHLWIFFVYFSIVVLAFEYFLSYPYCQIYIKEKCTRLIIKEKQRILYFWILIKRKQQAK